MQKLVECVPNISEGRNKKVIAAVAAEVESTEGVHLLDVDPGAETNRTVITFIGSPAGVAAAAFKVVAKAAELIDMRNHSGAHPRHGATDVCPFVPVRGVSMDECVGIARQVGRRIGEELDIPVYLYEAAAVTPERRNLAHVRKGEYEALPGKLGTEQWCPDFGPNVWNEHVAGTGATNVAARGFLVAYNVNLNTRNKSIASQIALDVKEAGRAQRDAQGRILKDENGQNVLVPGPYCLQACKAVGWVIPEYDRAQVSMNLVDTSVTKPHQAFEACRKSAADHGVRVTGSELVGLIPEGDMLDAGKHFLRAAGQSAGIPRRLIIETAIQSMGLRDIAPFDPADKIIEYQAGLTDGPLVSMTNREFLDELSCDSPAPGGGSVAALACAQAAALAAMVGNLTAGKKNYASVREEVLALAEEAQELKDYYLAAMDEDTAAFNRVMAGFRLPKSTPEQAHIRDLAIAEATREATRIPLAVLAKAPRLIRISGRMAQIGNVNSLSDAGVAVLSALAGAEGAYYNVLINLESLADLDQSADPDFRDQTRQQAKDFLAACETDAASARSEIRHKLESALT